MMSRSKDAGLADVGPSDVGPSDFGLFDIGLSDIGPFAIGLTCVLALSAVEDIWRTLLRSGGREGERFVV